MLDPACPADSFSKHYYNLWKSSLAEGRSSLLDASPWITYSAIDLLENYLSPEMCVFEYGGGGSTLYFVKRVSKVVTVEHDEQWFSAIEKEITKDLRQNWDGLLRPAQNGGEEGTSIADPDAYVSDDEAFKGCHFREYASAINAFSDNSFDVVLVDGRARPSCLKHALPKIKPGGLLVLDNSDREYYLASTLQMIVPEFKLLLEGKGPAPYLQWFSQTTIWQKR
jgi:hypothetical protein